MLVSRAMLLLFYTYMLVLEHRFIELYTGKKMSQSNICSGDSSSALASRVESPECCSSDLVGCESDGQSALAGLNTAALTGWGRPRAEGSLMSDSSPVP